ERYGGDTHTAPLSGISYGYGETGTAPWPATATELESVPGQDGLVSTTTTTYRRDALGRPIEETRSDGSTVVTVYDRTGGAIRMRTGAGTQSQVSLDGAGRPIKVARPNGRGFTLYGYDLDGSLLRESTEDAKGTELWATGYGYDGTGRVTSVTYADG